MPDGLDVHGSLHLSGHAKFSGDLALRRAKVGGDLDMTSSSFARVEAEGLDVYASLFMDHAEFSDDVTLRRAKIGSNLVMTSSSFAKQIDAQALNVEGGYFVVRDAVFTGPLILRAAKIDFIDLENSTAASIELSKLIASRLTISDIRWLCAGTAAVWRLGNPSWRSAQCADSYLTLQDAHVDEFQDSPDTWPPSLDLEGFRYQRFGGALGSKDMRNQRYAEEWVDWLARDQVFRLQTYTQLSGVLSAGGDRTTSEANHVRRA